MKIVEKLLPVHKRTHGVKIQPKYLIIHWTGNASQKASGVRTWFRLIQKGPVRIGKRLLRMYASSHYVLGLGGVITQLIPEDIEAYTNGGRRLTAFAKDISPLVKGRYKINRVCNSVECTHEDWSGKPNDKQYKALVEFCADWCMRHSKPVENIKLHNHLTGKLCHKWFVNNPTLWTWFLKDVSTKLK